MHHFTNNNNDRRESINDMFAKTCKTFKVRQEVKFKFHNFIPKFKEMADNFLIHHEASKLSTEAFDNMIRNVVVGSVILLMDFQMNLGHTYGETIQAEQWAKK